MKVFELVGEVTVKIGDAIKNLKKTEVATEDTVEELQELGESGEKSTNKLVNGLTKTGRVFENIFKKSTSIKDTRTSLKELTDTVEKQESKLTELKNKYIQLYHSQGETSDEAQETASEIKKLSKSLKENKSKLAEAEQAANKFDETLEETGDSADEMQSKMSGAFAKIGSAIAAAFAIDKIKDFANACVEASAEVSAEISAFEQIMGDYSDQASEKMQTIADNTGMVSSRLTPYMTSMTAKFKGLGYDIEEATDLASDGLNLAADAAAFWDKSLDDSMGALNSFINGSYEGGEAIGLFANDTQMASFAVKEGIVKETKEWSNLDEARKQATRLEYAQAMMKASGAVGQASKESGQYANVQANLTEKWRQFKAQVGEPILQNIVIPAMEKLSGVIDALGTGFQTASKWCSEHKTTLQLIGVAAATLATAIGAYTIAQNAAAIATAISTAATTAFDTVMAFVTSPITLVVLAIGALVAGFLYLWNTSEGFRNFWINLWEKIKTSVQNAWNIISPIITAAWNLLSSTMKSIWSIVTSVFSGIWEVISPILTAVWNIFSTVFGAIFSIVSKVFNFFINIVKTVITAVYITISYHLNLIKNIVTTVFGAIKSVITTVLNAVRTVVTTIWNAIYTVVSNVVNKIKNGISTAFNKMKSIVSNVFNSVKNTMSSVWNGIWNIIKSVINKILGGVEKMVNGVVKGINKLLSGVSAVANSVGSLLGLDPINLQLSQLSLPRLAKGGVLEQGQVGVLEGDGAEAVVPLDQNIKWLDRLKQLLTPIVTASMEALTSAIPTYSRTATTNNFYTGNNPDVADLLTRILRLLETMDKTLYDKIVTALTEGVTLDVDGREVARVIRKYA